MRNNLLLATRIATLALALGACSEAQETGTVTQTYGPSPTLPPPQHSWIPTVNIASVKPLVPTAPSPPPPTAWR